MDVSVTELSAMRQQICLDNGHFTPISPIPPTPPPKTNQPILSQSRPLYTVGNPNSKASSQSSVLSNGRSSHSRVNSKIGIKSESCLNRRLAFTHQQSEGFDVAGESTNNLNSINDDDSQTVLPKFNDSKSNIPKSSCRVLAKRQSDGCLKLQFNSPKAILFEVNYNTHDVTCTFPPLNTEMPEEESASPSAANDINQPKDSSTPFIIHKPVLVKNNLKKEPEDITPPAKRQRISVDQEPFRLANLSSNEAGNSGFVSYKRSGSPEGKSFSANTESMLFNDNAEVRSFDNGAKERTTSMGNSYGVGGLFHHSPPAAFVFETQEPVNDGNTHPRQWIKPDPDAVDKNLVRKEDSKSVVSSSCTSPFLFSEPNADRFTEEDNLRQLQPKQISPKKISPAIEAVKASSPIDMMDSFSNFEQQGASVTVPTQSIDNIRPFNTSVFGPSKIDSEHTGYTSSDSDENEEPNLDYKSQSKKMGHLNYSNGVQKRRRKKLGESSNVAPIRTKGRTLQSRTFSKNAALDKGSESDTANKEQGAMEIHGKIESNLTIPDGSVEEETSGLHCFSESSVFKVPKRVSRVPQKKVSICEESLLKLSLMNENGTTSIETQVTECSNAIPSSDVDTVTTLSVGEIGMECDSNPNCIQSGNGSLEESVVKKSDKTKTKLKNTRNSVNQNAIVSEDSDTYDSQTTIKQEFRRKSSTDEVPSEAEHKKEDMSNHISKTKRKPKKSKSIETASDVASVCPDVFDSGSTSTNPEIIQKVNKDEFHNKVALEHQEIPKRRTRSATQREIQKQTSCTDTEPSESEQKSQGNPVRRKRKSKVGLQNQKSIESKHNRPDSKIKAQDELLIQNNSKQSNDISVEYNISNDAETIKIVTVTECNKVMQAELLSSAEEKGKAFGPSNKAKKKKVEKVDNEDNPAVKENTGSVSDTQVDSAIENNMLFPNESGSNHFPSEVDNEGDHSQNFTTNGTVQAFLSSNSHKEKIQKEKNSVMLDQDNVSVSSLNTTKSGEIDESSNVSKLESVSITPTKACRRTTKEVIPGRKVIKKPCTNTTEATSTSPLHNYKTQCTIMKLQKDQDSSPSKDLYINVETASNSVENQNVQFVMNGDCTITSVLTDDDTATLKTDNKSSILTLTPVKTKTSGHNLQVDGESKNYEMIDFTEMDVVYGNFETPLNLELNETSIANIPSKVVEKENKSNGKNPEVSKLFEENGNTNKCEKKFEEKCNGSPYRKTFHTSTNVQQPRVLLESVSPEFAKIENGGSFIAALSSVAKDLTVTTESVLNTPGTSPNADSSIVDAKEDVLSNFNVVEVEVETSPRVRRTRSKKVLVESPTDTTSEPRNAFVANCCVIEDNSNISEMDTDTDSKLVIVEECGVENESHPVLKDTSKKSITPKLEKATPRKTGRKRSKSKSGRTIKTRKSSSVEKETADVSSVEAAFQEVEKIKFTDQHFKITVHNLVRVLIDPKNSQDASQLIFHVIEHLHQTERIPMMTYLVSHDISTLLPITENCIVSALFQIDLKGKPQFHRLLDSVVLTLYNMVLGKEHQFTMHGLAALCRLMTEICKRQNNRNEPIKLCGELIKWEHQYAPYLIASIAGIWDEVFQLVDGSDDEENIFFGAIARGVRDKPNNLSRPEWKQCQSVLSKVLPIKATEDRSIPKTVSLLIQRIRSKCVEGIYEKEYLLSTPLIIYSRVRGWKWAKEIVVDNFVVPSLQKHTVNEVNEIAFKFFLNLYAEICYNFPKEENPYGLLRAYYCSGDQETDVIHFTAAITLLKLTMWKCDYFTDELSEWMRKWSNHKKVQEYEYLVKRRMMADQEFCISDIIEVKSHH